MWEELGNYININIIIILGRSMTVTGVDSNSYVKEDP